MKRLHSFAFFALVTPAITLYAGSVLAEQSTVQDTDKPISRTGQSDQDKQSVSEYDSHPAVENEQHDKDTGKPISRTGQSDQDKQSASEYDSHPAVE